MKRLFLRILPMLVIVSMVSLSCSLPSEAPLQPTPILAIQCNESRARQR